MELCIPNGITLHNANGNRTLAATAIYGQILFYVQQRLSLLQSHQRMCACPCACVSMCLLASDF